MASLSRWKNYAFSTRRSSFKNRTHWWRSNSKRETSMNMLEMNGDFSEKQLLQKEEDFVISLPLFYRNFLKNCNGGVPEKIFFNFKDTKTNGSLIDRLFGFVENKYRNIDMYYKSYKKRIPCNTLPIGIDSGGNLILLSVKGADYVKVYYCDHNWEAEDGQVADYSNLTLIADSFEEFINNLKSEEEIDALLDSK